MKNLKTNHTILFFVMLPALLLAQNPVQLQPWVEVFGIVNGSKLGANVNKVDGKINLPYKTSVYRSSSTGFYSLTSVNDILEKKNLYGSDFAQGDLNGDGKEDVVTWIGGNAIDTVIIYWGIDSTIDINNTTRLVGSALFEDFGYRIQIAQIIGDTIKDLIVTAPFGNNSQGKVYIYKGANNFSAIPCISFIGDSARYAIGRNTAVGDINNDGYNDLMVLGSYEYGQENDRWGFSDIYFGSTDFDTLRDLRIKGRYTVSREGFNCFDANGDHVDDLLWIVRDTADWIYIHYGRNNFSITPDLRLTNPNVANFGNVITNAGDMNGDGYNDIVVGAYRGTITNGYVFIFGGGPKINGEYDAVYSITQSDFGYNVDGVGDVDGDGLSDIIVGAPDYFAGQAKGYWGIFLGSNDIKVTTVKNEKLQEPQYFELFQNYPNPFNGETILSYQLEKEASVVFKITSILGQEITILNEGEKPIGRHQIKFDSKNLSSGWYVYSITVTSKNNSQSYTQSRAMIVEK